jgi:cobalt-zinc-cadmium efflux system protein
MGAADDHGMTGSILKWSTIATIAFVALETAAGVSAGSLALLADAGHNFTDSLALILAWMGVWLETRPPDRVKTYGYHRAGVLAAFINSLTLVGIAVYILYESWYRFRHPQPVQEGVMIGVAVLGLLLNVGIMLGLRKRQKGDVNIRAAFLHMLGDAIGSVGIILGAFVIRATGWLAVDPLLSALIAGLILWSAWDVIVESLNILLEGLPRGMTLEEVEYEIVSVPGVGGVHDLHVWSLGSQVHALTAHIVVNDSPLSDCERVLHGVRQKLHDRFGIHHMTLELERHGCQICPKGRAIAGSAAASPAIAAPPAHPVR